MSPKIEDNQIASAAGQTMVEYSLVLGVCVACVVSFALLSRTTRDLIDSVVGFFS